MKQTKQFVVTYSLIKSDWWVCLSIYTQYTYMYVHLGCNQWSPGTLLPFYGLQPVCPSLPVWPLTPDIINKVFSSTQLLDIFSPFYFFATILREPRWSAGLCSQQYSGYGHVQPHFKVTQIQLSLPFWVHKQWNIVPNKVAGEYMCCRRCTLKIVTLLLQNRQEHFFHK